MYPLLDKRTPCFEDGVLTRWMICNGIKKLWRIILGNGQQTGFDCALYTSVQTILLQDSFSLNVFGRTEAEKRKAGIEQMRRRMTLSLYFGKSYFEPMAVGYYSH
jgi:hypothetical protein